MTDQEVWVCLSSFENLVVHVLGKKYLSQVEDFSVLLNAERAYLNVFTNDPERLNLIQELLHKVFYKLGRPRAFQKARVYLLLREDEVDRATTATELGLICHRVCQWLDEYYQLLDKLPE